MNELIKINSLGFYGDVPTVSGRELHEALEVNSNYTTWFNRMCEYGFVEGEDFFPILEKSTGGRPSTDHALTIDTAKEICMIQRTEIGRTIRRYFIETEKKYRQQEYSSLKAYTPLNLSVREYNGQRVLTFKDIDTAHQKPKGTAYKYFSQNRQHFINGDDFYKLTPSEICTATGLAFDKQQHNVIIVTENGYLMIAKFFTDELSWDIQRQLRDYFRVTANAPKLLDVPSMQSFKEFAKYCEKSCEYLATFLNLVGKLNERFKAISILESRIAKLERIQSEQKSTVTEDTLDIIHSLEKCLTEHQQKKANKKR